MNARKEGLWVHYSLATPADPVEAAALNAAAHWVQHAPATERDTARLEKRTGPRARLSTPLRVLSCCGRTKD